VVFGFLPARNAARLDPYLAALSVGRLPPGGSEVLDAATASAESVILGLRLVVGIEATQAARPEVTEALAWARQHGLAEGMGTRTRLTQQGRLLANEVFARLLAEPGSGTPGRPTAARAASA
jgi:coproporphyrinogen III oxidase-like Fe-S oxidoreductase